MINLEKFCKNKETSDRLLLNMALTYRTNLKTLASILEKDESVIYKELAAVCFDSTINSRSRTLDFMFNNDYVDQEKAHNDFMNFYNKLYAIASKKYDNPKKFDFVKKMVLSEINDERIQNIKNKGEVYTDDEIIAIVTYQLKYALNLETVADEFGMLRTSYSKRIGKVLMSNPELKMRYDALAMYNEGLHYKHNRTR